MKNSRFIVLMPVALLVVSILLLAPLQSQELIRDSAGWARYINSGDPWMFHPHHLLYMPMNWVLLQAIMPFCVKCDAIEAGQIHSFIAAVIMVISVFVLIRHLTGRPVLGFMLAILLLVSQGVWVFALQPQAYAPLLAILSLLLMLLSVTKFHPVSAWWIILVAMVYSLSVLFHQAMVILAFPLAYYIIATKKKNGVKAALSVLCLSGFIVFASYMFAVKHVMGELTIMSFYRYITLFSQVMSDPKYFSPGNFSISNLAVFFQSQLDVIVVVPWRIKDVALVSFVATLAGMLIWNVRQVIITGPHHQERVILIAMILMFWILTIWANPTDYGWPSFILLPIVILTGISLGDYMPASESLTKWKKLTLVVLGVVILGVGIKNLVERILPMHLDKGRDYYLAESISKVVPDKCVVYENRQHIYQNLNYYFSRATNDYWDYITAAYYGDKDRYDKFFKQPSRTACIAVDLRYVDPSLNVSGKTGYMLPDQWSKLMTWMFEITRVDATTFTWREFDIVSAKNTREYLVIRDKRTSPRPIRDFWRSLDTVQSQNQVGGRVDFKRWRVESCSKPVKGNFLNQLCILEEPA